jgi:hypothetical protein
MAKHWTFIVMVLSLISSQICVWIILQAWTFLLTDETFTSTKETAEVKSLTGVAGFTKGSQKVPGIL